MVIDTEAEAPDVAAQRILLKLEGLGLIRVGAALHAARGWTSRSITAPLSAAACERS